MSFCFKQLLTQRGRSPNLIFSLGISAWFRVHRIFVSHLRGVDRPQPSQNWHCSSPIKKRCKGPSEVSRLSSVALWNALWWEARLVMWCCSGRCCQEFYQQKQSPVMWLLPFLCFGVMSVSSCWTSIIFSQECIWIWVEVILMIFLFANKRQQIDGRLCIFPYGGSEQFLFVLVPNGDFRLKGPRRVLEWGIFSVKMLHWFCQAAICLLANSSIIFGLSEFEKAKWKTFQSHFFFQTERGDRNVCHESRCLEITFLSLISTSPLCIPKVLRPSKT